MRKGQRIHGHIFTTFLAIWSLLTLLQQTARGKNLVRRIDPWGATVPIWTFFGPQPATSDYEFLYRDRLSSGGESEWIPIPFFTERRLLDSIFDPSRRIEKSAFDVGQELRLLAQDRVPLETIRFSTSYLIVLSYISDHLQHHPDAVETQFLLTSSPGYDREEQPSLVFASAFHTLERSTR